MKRVIKGFSRYTVSDKGEIENSKTGRILRQGMGTTGYLQVYLVSDDDSQKPKRVHKLVANAFLGEIDSSQRYVVDHINGVKTDNMLTNLRIVTNRENTTGSFKTFKTGVSYYKDRTKPYRAMYKLKNKSIHIGYYFNEDEAHTAYLNKIASIMEAQEV